MNCVKRILLGAAIPVDYITQKDALQFIKSAINDESATKPRIIIAQNALKASYCCSDPAFKERMESADLLLPDGAAISILAKALNRRILSRITGVDFMEQALYTADAYRKKIFLFGASEKVCAALSEKIKERFTHLIIAGALNGYFSKDQENDIIGVINRSNPDMLFIALGSPKQENWIFSNRARINARICMGVGGSFDIISGAKKRAPYYMRKRGMEWVCRLLQEPHRIMKMRPYAILLGFTLKTLLKNMIPPVRIGGRS